MDSLSYRSLGPLRQQPHCERPFVSSQLVPFGPLGGGQWTGHPIGLVIVLGFLAMGIVGIPEWRGFFLLSAMLGAVLGCALWLWHRSKAAF